MKYDRDSKRVVVSSEELSSFVVKKNGAGAIYSLFQPDEYRAGFSDAPENSIFSDLSVEGFDIRLVISGTVETSGDRAAAAVKKKVRRLPGAASAPEPSFFAQSLVNAYIVCMSGGNPSLMLSLVFESPEGTAVTSASLEAEYLKKTVEGLLRRALPLISAAHQRGTVAKDELNDLGFPYETVREGQRDLMVETMRTIRKGAKLLACAPTGIGKTVSVLYPALKSLGAGFADKIFYLTAKSVTGKAALDLLERISDGAPHVRAIMLEPKEKLCSTDKVNEGCRSCPLLDDLPSADSMIPPGLRLASAAAEVLKTGPVIGRGTVLLSAEKHRVCPHELFLRVSEFCDVVVCDCNYVFDGRVMLRRYFADGGNGERFVFLADEAHNLPDRIRDMYSGSVRPADFEEVFNVLKTGAVTDEKLEDAVASAFSSFGAVLGECSESSSLKETGDGEVLAGYIKRPEMPEDLFLSLSAVKKALIPYARGDGVMSEPARRLLSVVSKILFCSEVSDEKFRFLAERENNDLRCSVVCLDPSEIVKRSLRAARASVMFSATLSPKEYFTGVLGFLDEEYLELDSPFDPSHLSVTVCDSISTRLSDRKKTVADLAEMICAAISERPGKYIVYFPSFEYLKLALREFARISPDVPIVEQKSSMTRAERNRFISLFSSDKHSSLVGFSVLGGMFSEGIDLSGDDLIGVVVVGAGLSGITSQLNMIGEYYDEKYERGYEFAYLYPAVNRIQQAVGRVIRTENDVGCAVLIDDRLADPSSARLFPTGWHPIKIVSDPESLSRVLREFWNRRDG